MRQKAPLRVTALALDALAPAASPRARSSASGRLPPTPTRTASARSEVSTAAPRTAASSISTTSSGKHGTMVFDWSALPVEAAKATPRQAVLQERANALLLRRSVHPLRTVEQQQQIARMEADLASLNDAAGAAGIVPAPPSREGPPRIAVIPLAPPQSASSSTAAAARSNQQSPPSALSPGTKKFIRARAHHQARWQTAPGSGRGREAAPDSPLQVHALLRPNVLPEVRAR